MAEQHTHHHHHHHHQHHQQQHDYVKANADHFTERAQSYRSELSLELAKRCAACILKKYSFDPNTTEVLDFACGPGLIAQELLPHAKRIVGADAAQGMVDVFNRHVEDQGISKDKLRCMKIDSLKGDGSDLDGALFDVIFCSQSYHHFEDPIQMTRALAQRLKPKGRLIIIDFFSGADTDKFFDRHRDSEHAHVVAHKHGFSSEQMINMFKEADLRNPQVDSAFQMSKSEMKTFQGYEVFGQIMNTDVDFTFNYFIAYADKA